MEEVSAEKCFHGDEWLFVCFYSLYELVNSPHPAAAEPPPEGRSRVIFHIFVAKKKIPLKDENQHLRV